MLGSAWTGDAAAVARSRFDEFVTAANKTARRGRNESLFRLVIPAHT
jgi:hypothetical protein